MNHYRTYQYTPTMSDPQTDLILRYFKNQLQAPGRRMAAPTAPSLDRFKQYDGYARFQSIEQHLGRKAKRTLDANRTSRKYYIGKAVLSPMLDHYENMDWWERDASYDFYSYIDGPAK
jgi:hypothetical protein